MRSKERDVIGKKQTCRLCGKEYVCDYKFNCPHCGIEMLVLDFIEDTEFADDDTLIAVSVWQLRQLKNYYRTKKLEIIDNEK